MQCTAAAIYRRRVPPIGMIVPMIGSPASAAAAPTGR
jgi:hypothetical protein